MATPDDTWDLAQTDAPPAAVPPPPSAAPSSSAADTPIDYGTLAQQLLQQPTLPQPDTTPVTRGLLSRIGEALGGGQVSGVMSPAQQEMAGLRSLRDFGTSLIAGSGYYPGKPALGAFAEGFQGAERSQRGSEQQAAATLAAQQQYAAGQQQQYLARLKEALPYLTLDQQQRQLAEMRRLGGGGGAAVPGTTTGAGAGAPSLTPFVAKNLPAGISSDEDQMVRTVYGEARGQPLTGQQGVAAVIKNRMAAGKQDAQSVIFTPGAFSPWSDKQRPGLEALSPSDPQYQDILNKAVRPVMSGDAPDPTGGATHFYAPALMPQGGPSWAAGQQPSAVIGGHQFYKLPYGAPQTAAGGSQPPAPYQVSTAGNTVPGPPGGSGGPDTPWDLPGTSAAAPPPAASATPPASPPAATPPDFQMRPLTPTEQAQTSYDLDPQTKADLAVRKAGAVTPDQYQAVLKDEAAALQARRKDADAARLTIESAARKDWQAQTHPATEQELAANNMTREPGVHYLTDNQGKVTATAIPVDPRGVEASKADQTRYQKNYAEPFDQTRPLRSLLNEMDALNATIERDRLGGRGGITAEYARKAQGVLSALGLSSDTIREGVSSQEAYQALSNQLILRLKAASGTSLGQMSDRDLAFIQSSAPNLAQTVQGRQKITAALRQIFDYQGRLYDAATDAIHDPTAGYTLRDLNKKLAAVPEAIPTLPHPKSSQAELQAWKDQHHPRRGMAYYGGDGQVHLWGVPEPAQGQ